MVNNVDDGRTFHNLFFSSMDYGGTEIVCFKMLSYFAPVEAIPWQS